MNIDIKLVYIERSAWNRFLYAAARFISPRERENYPAEAFTLILAASEIAGQKLREMKPLMHCRLASHHAMQNNKGDTLR